VYPWNVCVGKYWRPQADAWLVAGGAPATIAASASERESTHIGASLPRQRLTIVPELGLTRWCYEGHIGRERRRVALRMQRQ
jgi:hypothetical protein